MQLSVRMNFSELSTKIENHFGIGFSIISTKYPNSLQIHPRTAAASPKSVFYKLNIPSTLRSDCGTTLIFIPKFIAPCNP